MHSVRVNRKGADRWRSGHPWIFTSDVIDRGDAQPGEAVKVMDPRGESLGTAHFSSTSQITLRMLSPNVIDAGAAFFLERIRAAEAHRKLVVPNDSSAYRLTHGEGDLLPGLVIDRYENCFVIQTLSQGMDKAQPHIVNALTGLFQPQGIVARNDAAVRKHESLTSETVIVHGEVPARVGFRLNGMQLEADLVHGQKTGIFLDQRENYKAAARYARGRALDCFTSTGGFALHLAKSCETVEAIDSSPLALELAQSNATRNNIENIRWKGADVFDILSSYSRMRVHFDTIVLDPPAFAKSRNTVDAALRGYKDINLRALRLLAPGGVLVTCSCSHHVSEADLLGVAAEAALDSGRTLRVLERRAQAQDHPILLTVPETLYLKCLILQVV